MNKETYEALKEIIKYLNRGSKTMSWSNGEVSTEIEQVDNWIDEVAKEYESEDVCEKCGEELETKMLGDELTSFCKCGYIKE